MNKRLLSILLVLILTMTTLLIGCGGNETGDDADADVFKVAIVANQKFGDNGPMDSIAEGADRAAAEFGIELKKLESASAANFEDDIRAMSEAGYDLIITTFGYMTEATKMISKEYPDTKYAAIFQDINAEGTDGVYENIWGSEFRGASAFYVDGYIAGMATKTNKIGLIIGAEEAGPNSEGNGFMRGVKAANPNANIEFAFVGSYEDPAKAKEIASAMIAKGCDIIQTDCGATDTGVVEAAKEDGTVLVMGCITDYYDMYAGFVGEISMGFGDNSYDAIKMAYEGNFPGGTSGIRDITNNGYYLDWPEYERFSKEHAARGADFVPILKVAKELEVQILDGTLIIDYDTTAPNWSRIKSE